MFDRLLNFALAAIFAAVAALVLFVIYTAGRRIPISYRHGRFSGWLYVTGADFTER